MLFEMMKIVYCTDTVCYPGGIQTVTMVKANALAKIHGNRVWIVVTDHTQEPMIPLENVELVNLDVNYYEDDWKGYLYVLKGIFKKRRLHQKRLQRVLNEIEPDIVVSTGTSEKNFLPTMRIPSSPVFIREIHFEKNYRIRAARNLKDKMVAEVADFLDYGHYIKAYDRIVVLTEEDKTENWKGWNQVVVIPNPMTVQPHQMSDCCSRRALAAGRLVQQKHFASLIRVWNEVAKWHPDWTLEIWGSGEQEQMLRDTILKFHLEEKVYLKGFTSHLNDEMGTASMFLLSSDFEGFPLVIIEAMSVGLPVVAYACPTGPKDIIEDGKNGFLIPMQDEKLFARKICALIEDTDLRKNMGHQAWMKSKDYQMDKIIHKWMLLFEELKAIKTVR